MDASARSDLSLPVAVVTAGLLVAACAGGGVTTPGDDEEEPGLDRSELEVTVQVSEEDEELASALGWEDRRVPGARVTLMKESATTGIGVEDSISKETDADGTVRFSDLLPDTKYRTKVVRRLSSEEVSDLGRLRTGVRLFAAGTKLISGRTSEVSVHANQTGSLVISEVQSVRAIPGPNYDFGAYVELYNNSDRTITLDGMVIGRALSFHRDFSPRPCSETRSFQSNPNGLVSRFFQAFPGSGAEHTVPPGGRVLVATDAIDHTEVHSVFPDLRDADFEFEGSSDPDNSDVPNMEAVGLDPWFGGHGLDAFALPHWSIHVFVSEPVDVEALPRERADPANDFIFARFPGDKIVDATTTLNGNPFEGLAFCADLVADRFDQLSKV